MKSFWIKTLAIAGLLYLSNWIALGILAFAKIDFWDVYIIIFISTGAIFYLVSSRERFKPGLVAFGIYLLAAYLSAQQMYLFSMPKNFMTMMQFSTPEKTVELIHSKGFNPSAMIEGYSDTPMEHLACGPYDPAPPKVLDALLQRQDLEIKAANLDEDSESMNTVVKCFARRRQSENILKIMRHPGYKLTSVDLAGLLRDGDLELFKEVVKIKPDVAGDMINETFGRSNAERPLRMLLLNRDPKFLEYVLLNTKMNPNLTLGDNGLNAIVTTCYLENSKILMPIILSSPSIIVTQNDIDECTKRSGKSEIINLLIQKRGP